MRWVRGLVIAPCPLLLEEEGPGSRRLLVGVGVLSVGGFGQLLLLAHTFVLGGGGATYGYQMQCGDHFDCA